MSNELLGQVADYYSEKLARFGETPQGVDWNGSDGQHLRFDQLCRVYERDEGPLSINDLGCGYGGLLEFVSDDPRVSAYLGIDVADSMIQAARARHEIVPMARFVTASRPDAVADYGIASGIFNVRLGRSDEEWLGHLKETLEILDEWSVKGFCFNCLTVYSDPDRMRPDLYYADPCLLFDLCKRRYSRQVALLHDYGLYEFSVLVRKEG